MYRVYQLPADGSLPEPLREPNQRPLFSAILRYHYDRPEEVARVRDWIAANKNRCRDIFVVAYTPATNSVQEQRAMFQVMQSFAAHGVRSTAFSHDPTRTNGAGLFDVFNMYSGHMIPHEPPMPQPPADVYRFVYIGGPLTADFIIGEGATVVSQSFITFSNDGFSSNGTPERFRIELRSLDVNNENTTPWSEPVGEARPIISAIVTLGATSVPSQIFAWVRQTFERFREVVIVAKSAVSETDEIVLAELLADFRKVKFMDISSFAPQPDMNQVLNQILSRVQLHSQEP